MRPHQPVAPASDHERYGAEPSALAALRLPPRALSVGGTTGSGVLRGRPGPRLTIGAAAAAAGGVAETDGSAVATGSGAASSAVVPGRTGRRVMPSSDSSS